MDWLAGRDPDAPELAVAAVGEGWLARLRALVPDDPRALSLDPYADRRIDPDTAPAWRALFARALELCGARARAEVERGGRLPKDAGVRERLVSERVERALAADPFVRQTRDLLALLDGAIEERLPVQVLGD